MAASLVDLLLAAAERDPDKMALRRQHAAWTYGDLTRGASVAAAALRVAGLAPGDRVGLLFRNSPEYVAFLYGALAAGLAVVPLNVQERASVLAVQVAHSGARTVVGDPEHPEWQALRAKLPTEIPMLAVPSHDSIESATAFRDLLGVPGTAKPLEAPSVARDDLAILLYTSGTTGRPKGVMLSHGNLVANNDAILAYLDLVPEDVGLTVMPFHFSYGNSVLHMHLAAGATLLLEDNLAYPQVVVNRFQRDRVTGFSGVPSTFAILMSRCRLEDFDLSSMRYLTQAGGAMTRAAIQRMRQLVPSARFFVMYGQTEATARLTYLPPEHLDERLGSIGIPLDGIEIEIRDPQGEEMPPGQVGELCARGPNIMLGYWRDDEATSQAVVDGWLHTGDLAHRDQAGFLYIDGRVVEMIKVGSFRVSPLEVEEVLATLPGIAEMAVASTPDELLGQAIKAVIVLREGAALDERQVKAHCRAHLASYKVPKIVEFARELPRTSSGKIQRFKLA
jgi:acyl-CoA synthetase (AMP-forming)/AMP-acid ligase II